MNVSFALKAVVAFLIGCAGGWIARKRTPVIAFILLALFAADASACSRCRRYGSACYYYKPAVVAPVYAAPSVSNVYVIQSNSPQPLVGQGLSAYSSNGGYQSTVLPYYDPTAFLSQSLSLVKAGQDAASLAFSQANSHSQRVVELQAPAVERLAAGQAASQVLKSAGLDPAHNTSGGSTGFFISRGSDGQMQVMPLQTAEIQQLTQRLSTQTTITKSIASTPAPQPGNTEPMSLLGQFCAGCHGLDVAAPKGGFYIGDDRDVAKTMRDKFFSITQHVAVKKTMPPANQPQPTDEQRAAILDEIQGIILKE